MAWRLPTPFQFVASDVFAHSLQKCPEGFWLDTASERNAEGWSYLGLKPLKRIVMSAPHKRLRDQRFLNTHEMSAVAEPFRLRPGVKTAVDEPPFQGGWVGYLGYEIGRDNSSRDVWFPKLCACLFDTILAYSHSQKHWWGCYASSENIARKNLVSIAQEKVAHVVSQIASGNNVQMPVSAAVAPRHATSSFSRERYVAAVQRALKYIADGDVYQLNLSQRFMVPWAEDPLTLYSLLRAASPAAYGAFFGKEFIGNGQSLCSISPELFLSVRGNEVTTRPIKGTRLRGATAAETRAARLELDSNAKERAELNMIVDLERNDLGRVCENGSVRVVSSGEIEELPTLLHRVGTVTGRLHPRYSLGSIIAACFPGGSVTGAPKRRAMQIIEELEPVPRGPYCGAIGWMGLNGQMDLAIAIRTALYDRSTQSVSYHAGSGIVAESDPELEYQETLHKAAAFFRATNATLNA